MQVDSHQHFWKYHPAVHEWIDDSMQVIRKDFLPADLKPLLKQAGVDACVAVQADQTEKETAFLLALAEENDWIKGVVGWTDLRSNQIEEMLSKHQSSRLLKGFRHVLQGEDPAFMLQSDFLNGISLLAKYGFTYDILIFPKHLDAALELVKQFPNQPFVLDHLAKPFIKDGILEGWEQGIKKLAEHPNLSCKISGMVTEADWKNWQTTDFIPYLDVLVEAFGTKRLMYGSDWPVCQVAATYDQQIQITKNYFNQFSATEQADIFGNNAIAFYHL
jgi:L-fuconolactonase